MDRIDRTTGDLEQRRKAKRDLYAKNGVQLENNDQIDREIVASYVAEHLLSDEQSVQEMVKTNPRLGQRIRNWLNDLLAKLGSEAVFVRRARDLYSDALKKTQGSFTQETTQAAPVTQNNSADPNADFDNIDPDQVRQWALDAYAAGQISEGTLDQILESLDTQEDVGGAEISPEEELHRIGMGNAAQHSISPTFAAEIDAWDGKAEKTFYVGSTSDALQGIGVKATGIIWHSAKIGKIMKKHGAMTKEIVKQVPEILEHPVAVLASKQSDSRLVIFGTVTDVNENPVTAVLELQPTNKGGQLLDMTVIASAYGKEGDVGRFVESSGLVYLDPDRKRTEGWMQGLGLQLPSDATAFGSIGSVSYPDGKVKIESVPYDQYMQKEKDARVQRQYSFSEPTVNKADVISELRSILQKGGDPAALRQYVSRLEQNTGNPERSNENAYQNNAFAERNNAFAYQKAETAEQILAAAKAQEISVEEYLEQNWEHYDIDGQWNAEARKAMELEERGQRQHSISDNRMTDAELQAVQNIGRKSVNAFDQADVQATKRFAQQYWKQMGVKSPFFRAWFGDWRAKDQTPVQVATQKGDARGVQKNTDTGWDIQVSGVVFAESQHFAKKNTAAIPYLPYINDIVEKAVLLDSNGIEIGKAKSSNSLLIHSLYSVADIGNGPEVLKLYVEEMNDPNSADTKKRAYQLQNIEKAPAVNGGVQGNTLSSLANTANAIHTVADLFAAVKRMDSNFNPKPASKVVKVDGTPMVVYHGSEEMFTAFSYGHIGNSTGVGILGQGFYFTDKKKLAKNYGRNLYDTYLQIEKPYMAIEADAYKINVPQLEAQGYDGVILSTPSGNIYMVFNNTQIKSATDNVGTFDGGNPDIRYSISEPAAEATEGLAPETTILSEDVNQQSSDPENVNQQDAGADEDIRSTLPKKAQRYLKRAERELLNNLCQSLVVPWFARRNFLQPMVEEISNEYLRSGTVSQETVDRLFEKAYEEGIVVDREFYDQHVDLKKFLQTNAVTLHEHNRADIADYDDFRKRNRFNLRIKDEGGLPVDVAYQELQGMAPHLFPGDITHPADQLVRMADVSNSIRIAERSLTEYYGKEEPEFRKWAKNDFAASVDNITSELRKVKRFRDDRLAEDSAPAPETAEEALAVYDKLKAARRVYEKAFAKNLLTEHDEVQLGRLIRGEIELQHLDPETDNVSGITAVYEAKIEYADLLQQIASYKRKHHAALRKKADGYLKTANEWKDKRVGLLYMRETMVRNIEDIVPDKALAKEINAAYFEKISVSEAEATRLKNEYRRKVQDLQLSRKVEEGNLVSEAHAVQLLGEAMDNIRMLEKSRGRVKIRDGKHLSEWRAVVDKLWAENPWLDKAKIQNGCG